MFVTLRSSAKSAKYLIVKKIKNQQTETMKISYSRIKFVQDQMIKWTIIKSY